MRPSSTPSLPPDAGRRYGILGGTFDPPHYGHLALAETARVQLRLERVLFVPAGRPPHKEREVLTPSEDRAALVRAAIADNPTFALSRVDLDRPGPHYTAETLDLLRGAHPDVGRWYFLMGEDSLHDLPLWHDPEQILARAWLGVMPRSGKRADVARLSEALPQLAARLVWLDVPPVNFSATDLRRRQREGLPLRYLVPPGVVAEIAARRLYR